MDINFSFWALQTTAMMVTAILLPGLRVTSIFGALAMVITLALFNSHYWDVNLFSSLPAAFSIKTIFLLIVNGLIFYVLIKILPGIEITGFVSALIAPIIFTLVNLLLNRYSGSIDWGGILDFIKLIFTQLKAWVA
mgnify:CR=1 FL=1